MIVSFRILRLALLAVVLALPARAEQVTIFAASSLKNALDEVIALHSIDAIVAYGGSAAMARQLSQGAQADIIILAHPQWMDWLAERGALAEGTRCNLVGNTLVLAGSQDAKRFEPKTAQDLIGRLKGGRLAIGELRAVPAGQYAAQYLQSVGWLEALRPHLAPTSSVRLALALLARGETELALVYESDVFAEPRVRGLYQPPQSSYSLIRYPMALGKDAKTSAREVAKSLSNSDAIFAQNGFQTIPHNETGRCS